MRNWQTTVINFHTVLACNTHNDYKLLVFLRLFREVKLDEGRSEIVSFNKSVKKK